MRVSPLLAACGIAALISVSCRSEPPAGSATSTPAAARPSILLVTLDTTRADAIGPEAAGIETPSFNALAAQGRRFRQAYATVPETLPAHTSMMTGLYPAGHGIHENGRYVSAGQVLLAERLRQAGYETAAFVSSFILTKRFGLARGFDRYDDSIDKASEERSAQATTDATLAFLRARKAGPLFLWVHYFDPHTPYAPPEPYRTRFAGRPYLGEVASMDAQLGRLADGFRASLGSAPNAIIVVGDHGEGLGDHGEATHGNLLYQSTMHVPFVMTGPGVPPGVSDAPVSTRRVFHTILDWAGIDASGSLRTAPSEVVLGEAMKPFLSYGWQPQVMAVDGRVKSILAGRVEMYDVVADAAERRDLVQAKGPSPLPPPALRDYPVPSPSAAKAPESLDPEAKRSLASLGYVSAGAAPIVRNDAPRPVDMVTLFSLVDQASALFVAEKYAQAIPLYERIVAADPTNLDAHLRLATAHSSLGHNAMAEKAFEQAARLAPQSEDVQTYLALHYARTPQWERAVPLLEKVVAASPDRVPALEGLALVRERQGRPRDAVEIWNRLYTLREPGRAELLHLGDLAMDAGLTAPAIDAFERARAMPGPAFTRDLELGLLYLDARRFDEARAALDRVPPAHPEYPMALFKRAQVSVLLKEPDAAARIALARRKADATTRALIEREQLFTGMR